ncbi:MAG: TraR/DksA family transcriptional regulator [Acidimicrobiales bacterium]
MAVNDGTGTDDAAQADHPLMPAEAARQVLMSRLCEVTAQLEERRRAATPAGARPGFGKRAGDYVAQVVDDRTNNQLADSLADTLARIERALARVEEGRYGRCTVCGEPISPSRLAALPWAERCIGCQSGAGPAARGRLTRRR